MTTINWNKPIEYKLGGDWVPARFLTKRRNQDGCGNVVLYDNGNYESTVSVPDNASYVRNVAEKKKFWTVTWRDALGLASESHAGSNSQPVRVGDTYKNGKVINIVEGEYEV